VNLPLVAERLIIESIVEAFAVACATARFALTQSYLGTSTRAPFRVTRARLFISQTRYERNLNLLREGYLANSIPGCGHARTRGIAAA
jgi:hypothetical protein